MIRLNNLFSFLLCAALCTGYEQGVMAQPSHTSTKVSEHVTSRLTSKTIETIERAMSDELDRSRKDLKLQGLVDPFFIGYTVTDEIRLDIQASLGSILSSSETQVRMENVRLMVGDYQFNDENFSDNAIFGGGGTTPPDNSLPLEDDYIGIRRAFWLSTDALFKLANETYTKKKAAFEHKTIDPELKDIPDFAKAEPVVAAQEPINYQSKKTELEALLRTVSQVFSKYPDIQSSNVSLFVSNAYIFIQNTEGTKARKPSVLTELKVQAGTQAADDGEPLSIARSFVFAVPEDLPSAQELVTKVEELAQQLVALRYAPKFNAKEYAGPVLFEGEAARDFLGEQVISRLSAQREDILGGADMTQLLGGGKRSSLKDKLNARVLPKTFYVKDNPIKGVKRSALSSYPFDDEGVAPKSLTLVDAGMLKTLYMTRTPTKELREPNGHARSLARVIPAMSDMTAAPANVEITNTKGYTTKQLKSQLFEKAKENGYDFALIVRSTQAGSTSVLDLPFNFSDFVASTKFIQPVLCYRVSLKDGKEELVRNVQISMPALRDLKELETSNETATSDLLLPASSAAALSANARVPGTLTAPTMVLCSELEVEQRKVNANPTLPVVSRP